MLGRGGGGGGGFKSLDETISYPDSGNTRVHCRNVTEKEIVVIMT